jgi:hypothetical protein
VLAGNEIGGGGFGVAEAAVTLEEAIVEVAELGVAEGWGLALKTVGLDVTADGVLHWNLLRGEGIPPGGYTH